MNTLVQDNRTKRWNGRYYSTYLYYTFFSSHIKSSNLQVELNFQDRWLHILNGSGKSLSILWKNPLACNSLPVVDTSLNKSYVRCYSNDKNSCKQRKQVLQLNCQIAKLETTCSRWTLVIQFVVDIPWRMFLPL